MTANAVHRLHPAALGGCPRRCETTIDPATGQTQTTWTLPLTQANAEAAEQQWQQCVLYSSESYCERTLLDGRPRGVRPVIWARDNTHEP